MGLAPRSTQSLDILAFIDSANVPFVLREAEGGRAGDEGSSDMLLVGPCYIHGLMDGEAAKRNEAFEVGNIQIV